MITGAVDTGMTLGGARVYTFGFSETQTRAASVGITAINNYLNTVEGGRQIGQGEYLLTTNPTHVGSDAGQFDALTSWNSMPGKMVTYYSPTALGRPDFNALTEMIFHEMVHAGWNSKNGHPMGGKYAEPHRPDFYLLMEAIVVANGGYLEGFDSVEASRLYGKSSWFEKGGSPFENAVVLQGLSDDQLKLLVQLRGTDAVSTLRDHLAAIGASGAAAKLDAQYQTAFGSSIPPTRCFPAHTRIQTSRTTSTAISALRVGDVVLAFDARADKGRGALVPRRVSRLYRNTTTDWLRLRWHDGTAREVITTPGHHFLDELGGFPTIEEMVKEGRATAVLASGEIAEVTAERITYSAETAHKFARARSVGRVAGSVLGEGVRGYGASGVTGRKRKGRSERWGHSCEEPNQVHRFALPLMVEHQCPRRAKNSYSNREVENVWQS